MRRIWALLLVSGLLLALPGQAPSGAASGPRLPSVGVQFHGLWSDYTARQRIRVLDKMVAAGVRWVRIDMGWSSLQEDGPRRFSQWYIDRADSVIDAARARGLKVLATLWATPRWANGGRSRAVPPDNPLAYGRIALWAADHFKGRVDAWEIWNEPNHEHFFKGSATTYAALLKVAYVNIRLGDPGARVVLGGPCNNDDIWLEKVYRAGAAGSFDVMATHPYQGFADAPPETPDDGSIYTLRHVAAVRALMKRYGDGAKPIWFTEFGWSAHENSPRLDNWERGVTLRQQARFLVRTIDLVAEEYPYVKNIFWYNERDRDTGNIQVDNYGLLRRDLTSKPAFRALKRRLTG